MATRRRIRAEEIDKESKLRLIINQSPPFLQQIWPEESRDSLPKKHLERDELTDFDGIISDGDSDSEVEYLSRY